MLAPRRRRLWIFLPAGANMVGIARAFRLVQQVEAGVELLRHQFEVNIEL